MLSDKDCWEIVMQYEPFMHKLLTKRRIKSNVYRDVLHTLMIQVFKRLKAGDIEKGNPFQIILYARDRAIMIVERAQLHALPIPYVMLWKRKELFKKLASLNGDVNKTAEHFSMTGDTLTTVLYPRSARNGFYERTPNIRAACYLHMGGDIDLRALELIHPSFEEVPAIEETVVERELAHKATVSVMSEEPWISKGIRPLTFRDIYIIYRRFGCPGGALSNKWPDVFGEYSEFDLTENYGEDASLQEIGDSLGLTRERIRQLEERTLSDFKLYLDN